MEEERGGGGGAVLLLVGIPLPLNITSIYNKRRIEMPTGNGSEALSTNALLFKKEV